MADTHKESGQTHPSSSTMEGGDQEGEQDVRLLPALDRENVKVRASLRLDAGGSQLQLNLPGVSNACSIETSFVIVQWLRGGVVACDYDFQSVDEVTELVRTACLAVGPQQIKERYTAVAKRFMRESASKPGLPECTAAFGFLARGMPQFCFTTGEVEWCPNCDTERLIPKNVKRRFCVSFADPDDAQLVAAASERATDEGTDAGLSTTAMICDVFFKANPIWEKRCDRCDLPLHVQIRVLDRLPAHLVVEDSRPWRQNNIFEMCAGCDIKYTDGDGTDHCVKYPGSVASALSMLDGPLHFVALLHARGVANGAVVKDVQTVYRNQAQPLSKEQIEKLRTRVTYTILRRQF